MQNTIENNTNSADKYAIVSLWFPFANTAFTLAMTFLATIFLAMSGTNIEEVFMGIILLVSCVALILSIRYAVVFGMKSESKKWLAIIGITISVISCFVTLLMVLMCFVDVQIGLNVKIGGVFPLIIIALAVWAYKAFFDRIYKGKKTAIPPAPFVMDRKSVFKIRGYNVPSMGIADNRVIVYGDVVKGEFHSGDYSIICADNSVRKIRIEGILNSKDEELQTASEGQTYISLGISGIKEEINVKSDTKMGNLIFLDEVEENSGDVPMWEINEIFQCDRENENNVVEHLKQKGIDVPYFLIGDTFLDMTLIKSNPVSYPTHFNPLILAFDLEKMYLLRLRDYNVTELQKSDIVKCTFGRLPCITFIINGKKFDFSFYSFTNSSSETTERQFAHIEKFKEFYSNNQ